MILFVDSETSGLYDKSKPPGDPSHPWIVSLAADLREDDGRRVQGGQFDLRIRADEGRTIHPKATVVHGISTRDAQRFGVSEKAAIGILISLIGLSDRVVGHGIEFDRMVIHSIVARSKGSEGAIKTIMQPRRQWICTMKAATVPCGIRKADDPDSFKWPSLDEAAEALCGIPPRSGPHTAFDDVQRSAAVYFALVRKGLLDPFQVQDISLPDDPAFGFMPWANVVEAA